MNKQFSLNLFLEQIANNLEQLAVILKEIFECLLTDNKKPLILKGFAAPTSLTLSNNKIWVVDSALNRIVTASLDGKIIKTIPIQSAKSVAILGSDQWVLTWRGLQKFTDDGLSPAVLTKLLT